MTRSLGIQKAGVNGTIKVHKERENASCLVFSIFILTLSRIKISADIFYFILFYFFFFFFYFLQKNEFDISYKLSSQETICMECQIYFLGKNKKKQKHHQFVVC